MRDAILVLNAGSSSLKFQVFAAVPTDDRDERLARGQVDGIGGSPGFVFRDPAGTAIEERPLEQRSVDHDDALRVVLEGCRRWLPGARVAAVGHRVVHGGTAFAAPVQIDDAVLAALEGLIPLAPLHQPHNLSAIRAITRLAPDLPQVACFDTAFHRTAPDVAQRFALPRRFTDAGVRRYGFHGLSYEYVASAIQRLDPAAAAGRAIVAHLGHGASLCALLAGRSVATTMSFTPADGLVMSTRIGAVDPGVLLYLMTRHGLTAADLERLIFHESGLLGVSEVSSDMRTLLASHDPRAEDAVELFVYRIAREIGSLAAALGGLDALVFTAGIGENAPVIRAAVCRSASWLGVELDPAANDTGGPRISVAGSRVAAWVVRTDEEVVIARRARSLLGLQESTA